MARSAGQCLGDVLDSRLSGYEKAILIGYSRVAIRALQEYCKDTLGLQCCYYPA